MTMSVILDKSGKDWLMDFKTQWQSYLNENNIDFICTELIDGTFCTPHALLTDIRFNPLKQQLEAEGALNNLTIREVNQNEVKPINP